MPTHNESKNLQKMSEENQPLPKTIIEGFLLPTTHQKRQLKQRAFSPFLTRWHIWKIQAAPYKSSKWWLTKVRVRSASRINIGACFRFIMKQ